MEILLLLVLIALVAALLVVIFFQWRKIQSLRDVGPSAVEAKQEPLRVKPENVGSDALFATLSHELRTPLNGLLGIAQVLNEERGDDDIAAIEGCARHMLAVLSTLVNHSKIQAEWDDLPENREWVSVFELFEQMKRHLNFRASLRGLDIQVEHQDKTLRLRADYDHLKNIFESVILGSLECISLAQIPSGKRPMVIAWESTGGKVRVKISNPLEVFSEDRRELIRTVGGLTTGENHARIKMEYLYWAVSTMLLDKYEGEMVSQPVAEGGVETILSFEMEEMQASPTSNLPMGGLALDTPNTQPKAVKTLPFTLSILIAEDDPISRSLLSGVLKHMGQEATFATNGREVLDLVHKSNGTFDLILMDIDMPIMDGVSAAQALRNGESGEWGIKIPIVAVTAFSTLSDEGKFKRAGMNYFLPKPVRLNRLREVILEVVRTDKNIA